jgi:hypothetical protein
VVVLTKDLARSFLIVIESSANVVALFKSCGICKIAIPPGFKTHYFAWLVSSECVPKTWLQE